MKKILILLITLVLTLGMIGCSNHVSDVGGNNGVGDTDAFPSEACTDSDVGGNNGVGDTDAFPSEACSIEYLFGSVEDLNTYITTGSKDIQDYSFAPHTPLEDMPEAQIINARGYRSVYEFFSFDEADFDSVEASFTFTESGSIIYKYYLDNIFVTIQPVKTDNLFECYKNWIMLNLTEDDITIYTKNNTYTGGHVLRENADCNVMYYMVNGVKRVAGFIMNNCYVTINGTWFSDDTTLSKDFNDFMTNKEATAFSSFFSDDDDVFNNAAAKANYND